MYSVIISSVYLSIVLLFPKIADNFLPSDIYSLYLTYIVAILFCSVFISSFKLVAMSLILYLLILGIDWGLEFKYLLTEKVDSITIVLGASIAFIIPMLLGYFFNYIVTRWLYRGITPN